MSRWALACQIQLTATNLIVRLLGPNGEDLGLIGAVAALDRAQQLDLDLVPIDESTVPPTYRILDYGKWKYELHNNRGGDQSAP